MNKVAEAESLLVGSQDSRAHDVELQYVDIKLLPEQERDKIKVSRLSYYGGEEWDMTMEFPELRSREVTLKFKKVKFKDGTTLIDSENEIYLRQVKEFYYTLYTNPTTMSNKWSTYVAKINHGIKNLCAYMKENSIPYFGDLNEHDFDDYLTSLLDLPHKHKGKPITDRTLLARVRGLGWLYEQSPKMKHGLMVDPFRGFRSSESIWARKAANTVIPRHGTTKIIPDELLRRIFICALKEIEDKDKVRRLGEFFCDWDKARERIARGTPGQLINVADYVDCCTTFRDARLLARRIEGACYIITALLTGMRFHEVGFIRPEPEKNWKEMLIELGGAYKKIHFVVTHTKKLEPEPKEDNWQTVPIVKDALDVMYLLNRLWIDNGSKHLFTQRSHSGYAKDSISHSEANAQLNGFMRYHQLHSTSCDSGIWKLSSHQFRKTHARIMIRQGLGLKALQDQLKHYDIEMTKIYGDLTLYSHLHQEKFSLSAEIYEEFIGSQVPIIGGGADEVHEIRKTFMGLAREDRADFLRSLPKKALIEQTEDGLCFYRPKKALCGGNKHNCLPSHCDNAVINANENRRSINFKLKENERMIRFFRGDSFKVAHLKRRNSELINLVQQLKVIDG